MDKGKQSIELLERVKARLRNSQRYSHLTWRVDETVVVFLLCIDEMEKMKREVADG